MSRLSNEQKKAFLCLLNYPHPDDFKKTWPTLVKTAGKDFYTLALSGWVTSKHFRDKGIRKESFVNWLLKGLGKKIYIQLNQISYMDHNKRQITKTIFRLKRGKKGFPYVILKAAEFGLLNEFLKSRYYEDHKALHYKLVQEMCNELYFSHFEEQDASLVEGLIDALSHCYLSIVFFKFNMLIHWILNREGLLEINNYLFQTGIHDSSLRSIILFLTANSSIILNKQQHTNEMVNLAKSAIIQLNSGFNQDELLGLFNNAQTQRRPSTRRKEGVR